MVWSDVKTWLYTKAAFVIGSQLPVVFVYVKLLLNETVSWELITDDFDGVCSVFT